jgi:hypothetical protein
MSAIIVLVLIAILAWIKFRPRHIGMSGAVVRLTGAAGRAGDVCRPPAGVMAMSSAGALLARSTFWRGADR